MRRRLASVWLLMAALVALGAPASPARPEPAPRTFAAEEFSAGDEQPGSGLVTRGSCDWTGTSTYTFAAWGLAAGPYEGRFVEAGRFTIPAITNFPDDLSLGPVEFKAAFTVFSGRTRVSGTKTLTASPDRTPFAFCGNSVTGDMNGTDVGIQATTRYDARIETTRGTFTDRGTATVDLFDYECHGGTGPDTSCPNGGPRDTQFVESFASDRPTASR